MKYWILIKFHTKPFLIIVLKPYTIVYDSYYNIHTEFLLTLDYNYIDRKLQFSAEHIVIFTHNI